MKKIAIVGDIHLGKYCSDTERKDYIEKGQDLFFEQLVSDLNERGISEIVFTGDIHDNRTQLNVRVISRTRKLFSETLKDFTCYVIQGNHDLYFKTGYDYTGLEILSDIQNVKLFCEKTEIISLLGKNCYMVPWVIKEREESFRDFLKTMATKSDSEKENTLIIGHFELAGVKMEGKSVAIHGMETKLLLDVAKMTISGHYHGMSETVNNDNRILYVGSPYPLTFANANEDHGYFILDENMQYEYIDNRVSPKFTECMDTEIDSIESFENSFVKMNYNRNMSPEDYLILSTKIEHKNPLIVSMIPYSNESKKDNDNEVSDGDDIDILTTDLRQLSYMVISEDNSNELDIDKIKDRIAVTLDKLNL